jgi:hypothetical protein
MPSANLELVRSIYADWERGDFSRIDWAHPDIEFVYVGGPEPGAVKGIGEMAGAYASWLNAWEGFCVLAEDCRELDDTRVLALVHNAGRGKGSGLDIEQVIGKGANLFVISEGRVRRLLIYFDRERALAELGVAGEGDLGGPDDAMPG